MQVHRATPGLDALCSASLALLAMMIIILVICDTELFFFKITAAVDL